MFADEAVPQGTEEDVKAEGNQPIALPLFAVQLQNIVPVEVIAKRFLSISSDMSEFSAEQMQPPNVQLNLEEAIIEPEKQLAQVVMNVQALSAEQPFAFEISLKLLGLFTYTREYEVERVRTFLRQGTLSVMLPFARNLLMNLSSQLQVPLIVLPLVQLAPPPAIETAPGNEPQ